MKNNKDKKKLDFEISKKGKNPIDDLIDELRAPMVELNNMQLTQLNFIKSEVDSIIKNKIRDTKRIQKTFDMLLDLVYWFGNEIEKEYYDLLEYYKKIDFDVAKDYERFYLDIISEED